MEKQEAFENLSSLECFFFYEKDKAQGIDPKQYETLTEIWQNIRAALEKYHALTGLTLMH